MRSEEESTEALESKAAVGAPPAKRPTRRTGRRRGEKPAGAVARRGKPKAPRRVKKAQVVEAGEASKKPALENVKGLLELRGRIRKSRAKFVRQESWRYLRLKSGWRKPKGIDSKMRMMVKGWPRLVKIGYRGPGVARGLHPSGLRDVLISTVEQLEGLNPETDGARLSATLGARRRLELVKRAEELGVKVLNPRGLRVLEKG